LQPTHLLSVFQDRIVFPLSIVVTKLSGSGQDQVFMGVLRQQQDNDPSRIRIWASTTGVILCADDRFSDWWVLILMSSSFGTVLVMNTHG